jgi:HAD superfamily hydrolase (TIGR01509 family)
LSCREGFKKPDPEFYELALKIAAVKPEEVIFVDDKEVFTKPAEEIGMKGILYTYPDNAKLFEELKQLGVFI